MLFRALTVALALCGGFAATALEAAEPVAPSAARIRIFLVRKGSGEVVGNGYIADTTSTDQLIFILVGAGRATFTAFDGDAPGDTLTATGTWTSQQPITFNASATSPDQIVQSLLIPSFALLTVNVGYSSIVNGTPAQYIYKLQF
jgi:hypothetical protein